ncbi:MULTISPECIES: DUF4386 domain-containing protein [Thiomicrorhabdus]|uniref:DUF4386 domain-containing protein n=1 Tax=Thiomicrorhabdus heinhorstiae TaxID=2748010 RepID=A0ABS0BTT5_9GAMM|nr:MULTISPECIES: DUF4386 domain-containing protein [Thiomicrorhabdus]MBF6056754.1 DUF4386 domain-containing protein [Thiomicrorhabdus heinhorstiae]
MTSDSTQMPSLVHARLAGLLYLVIIFFGISGELFIRSNLIVFGDADATVAKILTSDSLFRLGFVADSIMLLCDVALAVLLFVLLKPVDRTLALIAMVFRLMQASILGMNLLNYFAAVLILNGSVYVSAMDSAQLNAIALMFLDFHRYGYDLGLIFFAVSNFILGYLIVKASYFPSLLGYGLVAAGMVYLCGSTARFVFPDSIAFIEPFYAIPLLAELAFCLWLLIKGIKFTENAVKAG